MGPLFLGGLKLDAKIDMVSFAGSPLNSVLFGARCHTIESFKKTTWIPMFCKRFLFLCCLISKLKVGPTKSKFLWNFLGVNLDQRPLVAPRFQDFSKLQKHWDGLEISHKIHSGERIDGDRHSQVRWRFVRDHDKPRLMGVAIAIYFLDGISGNFPPQHLPNFPPPQAEGDQWLSIGGRVDQRFLDLFFFHPKNRIIPFTNSEHQWCLQIWPRMSSQSSQAALRFNAFFNGLRGEMHAVCRSLSVRSSQIPALWHLMRHWHICWAKASWTQVGLALVF